MTILLFTPNLGSCFRASRSRSDAALSHQTGLDTGDECVYTLYVPGYQVLYRMSPKDAMQQALSGS